MVCWMAYLELVKQLTGVGDEDARRILQDIEGEVGHDKNLIKAIVDAEKEGLARRLRKKRRKEEKTIAYA